MQLIKVRASQAADAEVVDKASSSPFDQPVSQQVNKQQEPKDQDVQSVPLTILTRPATSEAFPATSTKPVKSKDPQMIEPATAKEVIEITDDNRDDLDQAGKSVPRPKTPVPVTATDRPETGQSGPITDAAANTQILIKQGSR